MKRTEEETIGAYVSLLEPIVAGYERKECST